MREALRQVERSAHLTNYLERGVGDWSIVRALLLEHDDQYYFSVDMSRCEIEHSETLDRFHVEMREAGLRPMGDLYCTRFRGVVVRGYVDAEARTFGSIQIDASGRNDREFLTGFSDGSRLTTTTAPVVPDLTEQGVSYQQAAADTPTAELLHRHLAAVENYRQQVSDSVELDPTLRGLAEALDDLVGRLTPRSILE